MSATNSRIAHLRRIKADLQDDYWGRKANHTALEAKHFTKAIEHLDALIREEMRRSSDYALAA